MDRTGQNLRKMTFCARIRTGGTCSPESPEAGRNPAGRKENAACRNRTAKAARTESCLAGREREGQPITPDGRQGEKTHAAG